MIYLVFGFIALVVAISFVKQQTVNAIYHVSHRVSGKPHLGIWLYALLFFPGTVIHELSHFFAAEILQVKTGEIHLFPKREESYVTLGHVMVAKTDVIRSLLIGSAPFFVGVVALCAIVLFHFQGVRSEPFSFSLILSDFFAAFKDPLTLFALYFMIVISHAMFLSENDRKEILFVPVALVFFGILFYLLKDFISIPNAVVQFVIRTLTLLDISLAIVLVFNTAFFIFLAIIKKGFQRLF